VIHVNHETTNSVYTPIRNCNPTGPFEYCALQIPLLSYDIDDPVDANITKYYRITKWPLLGDVYQVAMDADLTSGMPTYIEPWSISPVTTTESVTSQWVTQVMAVSSQYSNCGPQCYVPTSWTCPSTCIDTSYSANNIVGAYDWYPQYSAGSLAWKPAFTHSLEYIEVDFGNLMYITSIEIYEVWNTGGVVKISATSSWFGDFTEWTTVWESPNGAAYPGSSVSVFAPSLCACIETTRYLRIELDSTFGRPSIDAIKMIGTVARQKGQLIRNGVVYYPPTGIASSILTNDTSNSVLDFFNFKASDCLMENTEDTVIEILPTLEPVVADWLSLWWGAREPNTPKSDYIPYTMILHSCRPPIYTMPFFLHYLIHLRVLNYEWYTLMLGWVS
jgi:hypothetical protein